MVNTVAEPVRKHQYPLELFFNRAISAHLPPERFERLKTTTVLMGGVGGGSNIAELLARKGIGHLIISDIDVYEPHNIRQRCSLISTLGMEKVRATEARLKDVHPYLKVTPVYAGIQEWNAEELVKRSDIVVDMLDLHAIKAKVALHQAARKHGRYVLTTPSVINGAMLWIFSPDGMTFEEWAQYDPNEELTPLATRLITRALPWLDDRTTREMYHGAARGERTLPLDAVGVEQAAVMTVAAIENIVFKRFDRLVIVPKGIYIDTSRGPENMVRVADINQTPEPLD